MKSSPTLLACLLLLMAVLLPTAQAAQWQAPAGATQIPLWPQGVTIARPEAHGEERVVAGTSLIAGQPVQMVEDVTRPTMTVFPPKGHNTGATVIVFPGGGYTVLAIGAVMPAWHPGIVAVPVRRPAHGARVSRGFERDPTSKMTCLHVGAHHALDRAQGLVQCGHVH